MSGRTRRAAPARHTRPAAARSLRRSLTSRHSRGAGGRDQHRREAPRRPVRLGWAQAPAYRGRGSNPLPATAAAEAAGKRRGTTASGAGPALLGRSQLPPPVGAMGWEEKQVRGYSEFVQTAQRYHGRPIFALFCGDKDAEGKSWCPDCVTGEAGRAPRGAPEPWRRGRGAGGWPPPLGPRGAGGGRDAAAHGHSRSLRIA